MLHAAADAQTKQNTLVSLWTINKRHGAWKGETSSPLSVASLHKLSMVSLLILDEQQKKVLTQEARHFP